MYDVLPYAFIFIKGINNYKSAYEFIFVTIEAGTFSYRSSTDDVTGLSIFLKFLRKANDRKNILGCEN